MSDKELLGKYPFDINARVTIQLGRESISSSVIAFSELVKNSYDADAEDVNITFSKEPTNGIITIEDNGNGMSLSVLLRRWLLIGTDNKRGDDLSRSKKRALTGAKGLGRLGIDRLCEKLILQTKTADMKDLLELHVDWGRFEEDGHSLSDIEHDLYRVSQNSENVNSFKFCESSVSGTRVILQGVKDEWNEELIDELAKELSLLVSPFGGVNDFKIRIHAFNKTIQTVDPSPILDGALWKLDAEIDAKGDVSASLYSKFFDEDIKMDPVPWAQWLKGRGSLPDCGPVKLSLYYLPQVPEVLERIDYTRKNFRGFMALNQGVRIYRDHFRVKPYGDPNSKGDWLNLAFRRISSPGGISQGGWKVAPNQLIGAVFIGRKENSLLEDQTNREGLQEGTAFSDLQAAVLKFVDFFEYEAHRSAEKRGIGQLKEELRKSAESSRNVAKQSIAEADKITKTLETKSGAEDRDKNINELKIKMEAAKKALRKSEEDGNAYENLLKDELKALDDEKNTLSNLASLGILSVTFSHEALEHCNLAAANAKRLKKNYEDGLFQLLSDQSEKFLQNIKVIVNSTKFIRNFSKFALGNVRPDKRRMNKNLRLNAVIEEVFEAMAQSLGEKKINFDLSDVPSEIAPIRGFEIDWESTLINLIANSIQALSHVKGGRDRLIRVTLMQTDTHIRLDFSDSGCGFEAGIEARIFEPKFSTRRDLQGNVVGTGMGLSIVRTFVEDHSSGSIIASSPCDIGGARFEISVPRSDVKI
ncbi:ATP-binding protein [Luteolibacter algae]|uniref:histidine kinase n=1 Tax=Luteolibacter algae TaxID=454151 RepID=A0ABW5D9M1_9BACT